jgi:hypothetical protein
MDRTAATPMPFFFNRRISRRDRPDLELKHKTSPRICLLFLIAATK